MGCISIRSRSFFLFTAILISCVPCRSFTQESFLKGDINADHAIDGRDALMIMQFIEGSISLSDSEIQRGDVYPLTGTEGRRIGDGELTADDAQTILFQSVGLIPIGEITGDYTLSEPIIKSVEPNAGPVGTEVILHGENYPTSNTNEVAVYFGDTPAEVISVNGVQIKTKVPEGAQSSLIHIITPGGNATSTGEFFVLTKHSGILEVDGDLNPQDFLIFNPHDVALIENSSGSFDIHFPLDDFVLIGASSDAEADNTYHYMHIPGMTLEQPFRINAFSTAKAMVFMSPFLNTKDPLMAQHTFTAMEKVDEVQALAQVIAERYPNGADGLNDPAINTAWEQAVISTLEAVSSDSFSPAKAANHRRTFSTDEMENLKKQHFQRAPHTPPNTNHPDVKVYPVDSIFTEVKYKENQHAIEAKLQNYSPLDWVASLYRLDPNDFSYGMNESRLGLVQREQNPTGYECSTILTANQWTAKIDILYALVDMGMNALFKDFYAGDTNLPLQDREDGLYLLHAYSGTLIANEVEKEDYTTLGSIYNGQKMWLYATAINVAQAAVDLWDLKTGESKRWSRAGMKKGIQNAVRKLTQGMSGKDLSTLTEAGTFPILMDAAFEAIKGFATAAPQGVVTWGENRLKQLDKETKLRLAKARSKKLKKVQKVMSTTLKNVNALLGILDKTSSMGRIAERLLALGGRMINVYDFELSYGTSPVESYFIVVGDPFSPEIHDIQPRVVGEGSLVTVTGKNFAKYPEENIVKIGSYSIKADSVQNRETLTFRVPNLLFDEDYTIRVETPGMIKPAESQQTLLFKRIPILDHIEPTYGFAPDPNDSTNNGFEYFTFTVELHGQNLRSQGVEDQYYVGSQQADVVDRHGFTDNEWVSVALPKLSAGEHNVYIQSPENDGYKTKSLPYTVLGPPHIQNIEPVHARAGRLIVLEGNNFGHDSRYIRIKVEPLTGKAKKAVILSVTNTKITFEMPNVGDPGEKVYVTINTPSGTSNLFTMFRERGSEDSLDRPEEGWRIEVNSTKGGITPDGDLTVEEAVAIARGDIDPHSPPWDDRSEAWYIHYKEVKKFDEDEKPYYEWKEDRINVFEIDIEKETYEVIIKYRVNHYHEDNGGDIGEPYEIDFINRDLGPGQQLEEGDLVDNKEKPGGRGYADNIVYTSLDESSHFFPHGSLQFEAFDDILLPFTISLGSGPIQLEKGSTVHLGTVTSSANKAIHIKGDKNNVYGNFTDCTGDVVFIEDGIGNIIDGTIVGCLGYGIYIQGGADNRIRMKRIESTGEDGIYIKNSELNEIYTLSEDDFKLIKCGGNAITLNNATDNEIRSIDILDSNGDGIVLENGSHQNGISGLNLLGNRNGIVVDGKHTRNNQIGGIYIGFNQLKDETYTYGQRHEQNGIYLLNGAHHNDFTTINCFETKRDGIRIKGNQTRLNTFHEVRIGMLKDPLDWKKISLTADWPQSILGNGITLQEGANQNVFIDVKVMNCEGDGIHIVDNSTDKNAFQNCEIGVYIEKHESKKEFFANLGYGIYVANGPEQNTFQDCNGGYNIKGGAYIENIKPLDYPSSPITLFQCEFGFKESSSSRKNPISDLKEGNGITLNNCISAHLDMCHTYAYENGISIEGTNSKNNSISDFTAKKAINKGFFINGSQGDQLVRVKSSFCPLGFHVQNGNNIQLKEGNVANWGQGPDMMRRGLLVENSRNLDIQTFSSIRTLLEGIKIQNSRTITLKNPTVFTSQATGLLITNNSENVTIKGGKMMNNQYYGIHASQSKNIEIDDVHCSDNEVGVNLENVNDAQVTNSILEMNRQQGIVVDGDKSDEVVLQASFVFFNNEEGIKVLNGKTITIGGFGAEVGNHIQGNQSHGIYARDNQTNLSIVNNFIGSSLSLDQNMSNFSAGNKNGIAFSGVQNSKIENNHIIQNSENGIWLHNGSQKNYIGHNVIKQNGMSGVFVDGSSTLYNSIANNQITANNGKGITLTNGGNHMLSPPLIENRWWAYNNLTGTVDVPNGSVVEVFADPADEGQDFVGTGKVFHNHFSISGDFNTAYQLHATVTTPEGDTSEFGDSTVKPRKTDSFVYTQTLDDNKDIFYMKNGSWPPIRITNHPADDYSPQLSPDGKEIVFVSDRRGNADLWQYDPSEDALISLSSHEANDYDPCSTPNSDILFVSERHGSPEIYTLTPPEKKPSGEILYGDPPGDFSVSTAVGDPFAMHFTAQPGKVTELAFYIKSDPAPFKWQILEWDGSKPSDVVIAEGLTDCSQTGWHEIDIEDVETPSDFAVSVNVTQDWEPYFGANFPPIGELARSKWYLTHSNQWAPYDKNFLFKVVVDPTPISPIVNRLTDNDNIDRFPVLSPNETQIAFCSDRDGSMDVWVMNVDGTNPRKVTDGQGTNIKPVWSANGLNLAFVSDRSGQTEIYQVNLDGSGLQQLTYNEGLDDDPTYSMDGQRLLFSSDRGAGPEIYSRTFSESRVKRLTYTLGASTEPHAGPPISINKAKTANPKKQHYHNNTQYELSENTPLELTMANGTTKPGDNVTLPIQLANPLNLGNLAMTVRYDPTVLRLMDVEMNNSFILDALFAMNPPNPPSDSGFYKLNWINPFGLNTDSEIATLTFEVEPVTLEEESILGFSSIQAYDLELNPMETNPIQARINIDHSGTDIYEWMMY